MAALQNFASLVGNAAAVTTGACKTLLDMTVGSVLRATLEGSASVALWLQRLILNALALTRLATSFGLDVDSWLAQFGRLRLPGNAASVTVQMTSLSPASTSAVVPVGALARTSDATLNYAVVVDSTNPAWSASALSGAGGYIRPIGTASILVPTVCTVTGTIGNVPAGAVNVLGTAISGIDTLSNAAAAVGGADAETDASAKTRFVSWILSLASGTVAAITSAVLGVQVGITLNVADGQDAAGNARSGYFTVAFDDGSGDAPDSTVAKVAAAVESTRAAGIGYAVVRATTTPAVVIIPISAPGSTDAVKAALRNAITSSVTADINATPVGQGYSYSRLGFLALSAIISAGITATVGVPSLNGVAADIKATPNGDVRVLSISVPVT